jgi:hypothetical protein
VVKTHYLPLFARPLSYARGLRILFGDQALFARAAAFHAVGGFDANVPIMEDADLCLKLHAGTTGAAADAADKLRPGRFRRVPLRGARAQLRQLSRCVSTDARRFEEWGNARGTATHVAIALAWYFGATGAQMKRIYDALYRDIRGGTTSAAAAAGGAGAGSAATSVVPPAAAA